MNEIIFATKIVYLVLIDGDIFIDAVMKIFPNEMKKFQTDNQSINLAKEAIAHYYLFENIINGRKIDALKKEKCVIFVVLANNFFTKTISPDDAIEYLEANISPEKFLKLKELMKQNCLSENSILFDKDSDFFYATKYNIPVWLIHMWRKHYGDEYVQSFLNSLFSYKKQTYILNNLKSSSNALHSKYPELSFIDSTCFTYEGEKRFYLTPEYKNYDYIDTKFGFKNLIDFLYNPLTEVLIYSGYDDDFVKTAIIKTSGQQGLNIAVPKLEKRPELFRFIRLNNLRNINLFEANDEFSLKAGVSYKQDLVMVFPKSSRFDIASKYPDYLLHFDRDKLDEILLDEKKALDLCCDYVNDDGHLVYIVNTLNKKESILIIQDFLQSHPDFLLIEEKQLSTSDACGTIMYYAILSRKASNND